jgi:WD40 repeat protein
VIDALDECRTTGSKAYETMFSMFTKIDKTYPLKIYLSSRPSAELEQILRRIPNFSIPMSPDSTLPDIRRYIEEKADNLPVDEEDDDARHHLIKKIVEKSNGCFLWVNLVMKKLANCFSHHEIEEALEDVPEDIEDLYIRNLESMLENLRHVQLAKTVLIWTLCATRPLTVDELKAAIKLDINDDVKRDLKNTIPSLCAQLVQVDKHDRVHMVHQTARSFLTSQNLDSEFRISRTDGNLRLSLACLKYLCSDEMKHSRRQRRSIANVQREQPKNQLAGYACMWFSEHLLRSTSTSEPLFRALTTFLRTNVLTWIQRVAQTHDLSPLLRAAKHFKALIARRAKHYPILEDGVEQWSTDLPMVVTEFGRNLLQSPAAIHDLIPHLCPRNSIIYQSFGKSPKGIYFRGVDNDEWDDRISCAFFLGKTTKCVAAQDQWYAVGLSDGSIVIYNSSTCAEVTTFRQRGPVNLLEFGPDANILASADTKTVTIWDVGLVAKKICISVPGMPMAIAFDEAETTFTVATSRKEVQVWSVDGSSKLSSFSWTNSAEKPEFGSIGKGKAPSCVAISAKHNMAAIAYRSSPLLLIDIQTNEYLGACYDMTGKARGPIDQLISIVFHPDEEVPLLAVATWNGNFLLFDTYRLEMVRSAKTDVYTLSVSPDGRILAGGNTKGVIQLFDFETLEMLYSVQPTEYGVTSLAFSSDSLRFFDTRDNQIGVWEPAALVWTLLDDDRSEPSSNAATAVEGISPNMKSLEESITSMVCCNGGKLAICGKSNGHVQMYNLQADEREAKTLYKHKGSFMEVPILAWSEGAKIIASADVSSRLQVACLHRASAFGTAGVDEMLLDIQLEFGTMIHQLLIDPAGTQILVSTSNSDSIWRWHEAKATCTSQKFIRRKWKWHQHPRQGSQLILVQEGSVRTYRWEDLEPISPDVTVDFVGEGRQSLDVESAVFIGQSNSIALRALKEETPISATSPATTTSPASSSRSHSTRLCSIGLSAIESGSVVVTPESYFPDGDSFAVPVIELLVGSVRGLLGSYLLVFLSESGWVCSIDIGAVLPQETYQRHFFVPFAWLSNGAKILVMLTEQKELVFAHGNELAVAQSGLDDAEIVRVRSSKER